MVRTSGRAELVLAGIVAASCGHPHAKMPDSGTPTDSGTPSVAMMPEFDGPITAAVHAGTSWYAGGAFTRYSASHARGVAHLDGAGNLTTRCFDVLADNSWIQTMALGNGVAYVAGSVTIGGSNVSGFFKLDLTTCTWDPQFQSGLGARQVQAAVVLGQSVYVGGSFTLPNSCPYDPCGKINNLVKLDARNGAIDSTFDPPVATNNGVVSGAVTGLVIANNSLYVAGAFSAYRDVADSALGLAKLDLVTGELDTTFSPPGAGKNGFDGTPIAVAVASGSLYVGGNFTSYRGVADSAHSIAKLDLVTGALDTTFDPPGSGTNGVDGKVSTLAVAGSSLYVGGMFTAYRGVPGSASSIAKLDLTTGTIDTAFSPPGSGANGFDHQVASLVVSGNALYVGGFFRAYRGILYSANALAKLDLATGGQDTTFGPSENTANGFDQAVTMLASDGGSGIFVSGPFRFYAGYRAEHIAKLDDTTLAPDRSFGPAIGFDDNVEALVASGDSLYVGGEFSSYGGAPSSANQLAKVDLASGGLDTTFSPTGTTANGFNGAVKALVVMNGSLYVGGTYSAYRGSTLSSNLAKLDVSTGVLDQGFQPTRSSPYFILAATSSALYVCGVGKLSLATGAIDPGFVPPSTCTAIAISSDETSLYVGAVGAPVGGSPASYPADLLQLDATLGTLDRVVGEWSVPSCPNLGMPPPPCIMTIEHVLTSGNSLLLSTDTSGPIKLDAASGDTDPAFHPGALGDVFAVSGNSLFVAGADGGDGYIAALLDVNTGAPQ